MIWHIVHDKYELLKNWAVLLNFEWICRSPGRFLFPDWMNNSLRIRFLKKIVNFMSMNLNFSSICWCMISCEQSCQELTCYNICGKQTQKMWIHSELNFWKRWTFHCRDFCRRVLPALGDFTALLDQWNSQNSCCNSKEVCRKLTQCQRLKVSWFHMQGEGRARSFFAWATGRDLLNGAVCTVKRVPLTVTPTVLIFY